MHGSQGSLIELPKKGKAMIITDIHGNISDLNRFIDIWNDFKSKNNHLVITGDFIHSFGLEDDKSLDVIISLRNLFKKSDNVHILLGNHEWSVISQSTLYKGGKNLSLNFESLLKDKYRENWKKVLEKYIKCFKKLPIAVKTSNKVFISHAGPPKNVKNMNEIINIKNSGYISNPILFDLLWKRKGEYKKKDLESFLKAVGCNAMIVGHTPVNGVEIIKGRQLIVSSSFTKGKKAYIELDLEVEIKNAKQIMKMAKYVK
jgi:Icc-related predicted phosphoesterase